MYFKTFTRLFLLIGMIGLISVSTLAQERGEIVTIGMAEESTFRLPCQPGSWYSLSEQIYTADEIANAGGGPGIITSLSFYGYNSWTTSAGTRTWDVYLVNTTKSTFSSASDWVGVNASQKVFSGTVTIIKDTWTTITINNFDYQGGNLLIVVDDNTGGTSTSSGHGGWVFNTSSNQSNWASSTDDINPSNPNMTCTAWEKKKNNIRFEIELASTSCPTPQNLVVSAVSSNSATLTWQAGGDETAWNVQYKTASSGSWSQSISVSSPTYTIPDLITNTDYQARVQAACSGEESGWKTVSFATECEAIDLPYYYNFSDASVSSTGSMPSCWHRFNDATNNSYKGYPRVNADYHHNTSSPTRSLLFNYSNYIPNQIAILPVINVNDYPLDQYQVVFWVRSASNKKLQVGTMTDPNNASTFRQIGEVTTSGSSTSWQEYTVRLDNNTYTEQEKYIAIKSPTTNASSAIYLDDIDIQLILSCEKPYSLVSSDINAHGATLSWSGGSDNWQIAYSTTSNFDPDDLSQCTYLDAPSNPYTITGLAPQTNYYIRVRSNCGDNNYSYWNTTPTNFNFTTTIACPAPTDLHCTSITKNSASLAWTKGDESQNDFTVAYSTTSEFDPETATQRQANSNSMILTGLTEGTTYYAKVRANCGGDDGSSNWSNQCSFKPSSGGELEVNQGTNTNSYVPVYGNRVQNITQSQFIIPSTTLSDIAGCVISKLTFHYSRDVATIDWGEAEFEVYVKEVDETAFASNATFNWDGMTKVYTGKLSPSNKTMEVEFDDPYEYHGGNLKIGFKQTKSGTKLACPWYGTSTSYFASMGGYNTYTPSRIKFLPWTTITYTTPNAQTVELTEGWNWWSTNIEMNGVDGLAMLEESLGHNGALIMSQGSNVENYYSQVGYDYWWGNLNDIQNETGYKIKVLAACDALMTGAKANPESHPVAIQPGWNWIGYTCSGSQSIAAANFQPTDGDVIMKQGNNATYYDNYGWWPDFTMEPGMGYLYCSNDSETKNMVFSETRGEIHVTTSKDGGTHWTARRFKNYKAVKGIILIDGEEQFTDRYEIGAFCGDECRASVRAMLFPITNQYVVNLTIGSDLDDSGELITFRIYDHQSQQELDLESTNSLTLSDFEPMGTINNWFQYTFVTSSISFTKTITAYTGEKDHYYLIASPIGEVSPENVTDMLSNDFDLYCFNQNATPVNNVILEWENWEAEGTSNYHFNLEPGKGYLYANSGDGNSDVVDLTFSGAPYSGSGVVTLTKTDNVDWSGWNLIGNPFGSDATLNKPFIRLTGGVYQEVHTENQSVNTMEGVFVQATTDGETATFTAVNNGDAVEPNNIAQLNIKLRRIVNNKGDASTGLAADAIDNAIIRFDGGAMLSKFMLNDNGTKVYVPQGCCDYAIVNAMNEGEQPVNFKAAQNGTYTIVVSPENVAMNYLHLIDNLTGAYVNLLQSPSYSFEAKTTDYASRFKLVFSVCEDADGDNNFAYYNGSEWVVANEDNATLQVVDIMGRVLQSTDNARTVSISNLVPGVYTLRLINSENVKTQKIVVR